MLDESGGHEAVVGISNWSLDPAKMNRAVHLYRPAPTVDDLSITAEGMVRSANLKGYLHELARAYNEIYHSQNHPDFWGLREFYSTVKAINNSISYRKVMSGNDVVALDSTTLLSALLRNFGGRPQEIEKIVECFFTRLGLPIPALWKDISTEDLIKRNLLEPDARHLMLLTKNNAALSLLLDRSILRQDKTEIIFGSDFPLDQNDLQVCINIQKVKLCMAEGITTVLVHCESLYESLYDLLNQHYVSYGGQIYVRLAFGTYTRLCPIDKNFRIIVIVEKEEAYTRLAPPLLNRFEKQVFERSSVLLTHQKQVLRRLQRFCHAFSSVWESKSQISWSAYRATFAGYHSDMLSSLILALDSQSSRSNSNEEIDSLFLECVKRLLWICTPEATCRLMTLNRGQHAKEIFQEFGVDCAHEYFQVQCHSSVFSFMDRMLYKWCDRLGTQATWITYSPLTRDVSSVFEKEGIRVTHVVLHELGQERELRQLVSDFFKHAESNSMLLLQCDPLATSRRRIEHSKFLVELMRVKRLKLLEGLNEHELPFCDGQESKDNGKKIAEPSLNIHVILLIHLPRSDSSESMFNIDFDSRWRVAFLDLVHNDDIMGLPSIESLIGKSLSEIFMSLDTQKVLTKTFRTSLSKLVYLYDRSNDDVRKQIFTLTKCLSQPLFIELVRTVISELIKQQFSVTDFELMNLALGTRELHLTGSFQGAIHRQILGVISTLFAVVLSQMDRNNNLSLFLEEDLSQSWIYLFNQSVNVSSLLSKIKWRKSGLVKEEVVEVRSDSYLDSAPFSSRYPFSFFLIPMVETMRRLAEDRGESFLQRHLSSMCFAHGVFEPMDNISISNFIYDFTCMKCREISNLPRSRQAEIVFHMLQHANSQSDSELQDIQNFPSGLTLISQIHFRFWKCERIMELYFDIMNCNIVPLEVFIHYLFEINSPISCSTHFGLLQLVICYLTPMQNSESCQSAYKLLFRLMNSIRSYYHALVDLLEDDSMKFLSMISWKKLEFFRTFLRDVCIPLDLSLEYVQTILPQFPDPYLATSTVLRKVLGLLNHLSFGDGVSYELLCPITLEKLQDPVIASDGFTYERSAIEEWFLSGKLTSPSTNEFLPNQMLVSNHYLKTKLLQHTNADLLKFFEYYVNDILFSHLYREKLDYQVIEDLIFFISGSKVSDIEPSQCLSPGERFIEGVLRQVFKSSNPKDQHHLNVCLELKLRECANKFGYLDTPLSMAYVIVREEFLKNSEPTFPSSISSLNFSVRDIENFRVLLELVAQIRNIFERYANILVTALESPDHSTEISSAINFFTPIVCSILEDPLSRPLTRLLRMYFLKLFGRTRGLSFVRDGLLQSPLRDSRWVLQWRASEDAGFTRFLGSNRLPKINPFVSYPLFTVVHDAFCSFIQSGDMAEFDAKITHIKGLSSGGLCGNLLLASFHELGLLALLPTDRTANLKNKISNFERWVLNPSGHLHNVPESYRKVIITLGLGRLSSFAETCPTLLLDETTPTEVIFRIRFSVHLVAVAMLFDSQYHPLRYIHSLVFCPELLQDNFFPTMPQDLTKMAQNVMGGRWYACPNNHPFYVDLCGRPTLIQVVFYLISET